jgi:hypothetical protein
MDQMVSPSPFVHRKPLAFVQVALLNGKSIGFLPLKVHLADAKASEKYGWPPEILVTSAHAPLARWRRGVFLH